MLGLMLIYVGFFGFLMGCVIYSAGLEDLSGAPRTAGGAGRRKAFACARQRACALSAAWVAASLTHPSQTRVC